MAASSSKKLSLLRQQHQHLAARIRRIEARQKTADRKRDTRRKILLGTLLMAWAERDAALQARILQALPTFLTRRVDRAVFDLPPLLDADSGAPGEKTSPVP